MTDAQAPPEPDDEAPPVSKVDLFRKLLLFQLKLALDGLRDLLLSPVSVIAVLAGMVGGGPRPDEHFRRLLEFGRRSDRWIDLFDAHESETDDHEASADRRPESSASAVFDAVERIVREEYARGGGLSGVEARMGRLRAGQEAAGNLSESSGQHAAASAGKSAGKSAAERDQRKDGADRD